MVEHYIVSGSSYKKGTRIAVHKSYIGGLDQNEITAITDMLKKHPEVKYSLHYVVTDDVDWSSVVAYDPFFKGMEVISDIEQFIKLIKADHVVKGIDIAKYLIAQYGISDHLQLEKLVYFCYADYLCKFSKKMFTDSIMAFGMGPVVDSVYQEFKGTATFKRDYASDVVTSRLMVLSDGKEIISSIEETMCKYGNYDGIKLKNLTHMADTPWKKSYIPGGYRTIIKDESIRQFHYKEEAVS